MKEIAGYEGLYWACENGDILSKNTTLKGIAGKFGYQRVSLYSAERKKKLHSVHRLIAIAFIPNPENKPEVNHRDGNKANNAVSNLEWVTSSENQLHAFAHGLQSTPKGAVGYKLGYRSKYHNVTYHKSKNKWVAQITLKGKSVGYKMFHTEEEAALHVNMLIDTYQCTDRTRNIII